ncbi:NAD-dependent epimerase/dehydratase family protein [Ramlibacter henchirensis]|uniref:NAD-dependent epimerase/dehydratase family protein n=1 Tax=Ramlibacter henchirensis TaxID=204072 RepID=A0A4Z0C674_9BURK|nr:D-erythronate dehydrogenase [Ramlibacter henchirensis]TFZ06791.1 NAD-dependent epimerase/dehydratase family protein [Ramlibacter henchirensis]
MNILITGGSGFLGARLARTLLQQGRLSRAGAAAEPITSLTLTDRAPPPPDLASDPRVRQVGGDLLELVTSRALPAAGTDVIFHLAAAVSGECEADFDLGMRSNFAATHQLLEACRALGSRPVFVFASSLAVFGKQPGRPMPEPITDDTLPTPQSSYGIQKFIGEQLVADYARKGFVTGRSVRLMTVSVRPGRPNGAASGFLSGMIRDPLAGVRAQVPVAAATSVALASPARTIEGIVRAAETSDDRWGPLTGINLPSLRTSVGEMAAALEKVAGRDATALLDWTPDPAIERLVSTWPGDVRWERARGLGLGADASFEQVVRDYVRENAAAIKLPVR